MAYNYLNVIAWPEIFYVIIGVCLGWELTAGRDYLIRQRERKELLADLHREVQLYRNNF